MAKRMQLENETLQGINDQLTGEIEAHRAAVFRLEAHVRSLQSALRDAGSPHRVQIGSESGYEASMAPASADMGETRRPSEMPGGGARAGDSTVHAECTPSTPLDEYLARRVQNAYEHHQLAQAQAAAVAAADELAGVKAKRDALAAEVNAARGNVAGMAALKDELATATAERNALVAAVAEYESALAELRDDRDNLESTLDAVEERMCSEASDARAGAAQVNDVTAVLRQASAQVATAAELNDTIAWMQDTLEELMETNSRLSRDKDGVYDDNAVLARENATLRDLMASVMDTLLAVAARRNKDKKRAARTAHRLAAERDDAIIVAKRHAATVLTERRRAADTAADLALVQAKLDNANKATTTLCLDRHDVGNDLSKEAFGMHGRVLISMKN
ncbi:uncharacterized protein AMSG_09670 [Thecamonas trahens ATCC 50062]|uniref:Uncharacterized protein n=1 Tax=Thecamonas trahens ATCC 50062 TaxID=461836 RepID=A0A0L0DRD7_THETB|nr:hypothetical protein AMSG_09670 [Thecamonas trahens ATCC 50062]KNC54013.1 hypothetical protein AMSG_09670 [Thecamonas trahens ATCC 50062]|eukprot:XP_013754028.1 hypothetical protein AMSG_09670 [Thecamonas trahens ATCC 50062]